jgi:serine/threonine-protein kinase
VSADIRAKLEEALGAAYTLDRELGGGGMSRVFVGVERALNRHVVVKVLPAEMAGHLSVERFRREITIAARLQHAHIVPLLSSGEFHGLPYFTMPFVDGESLRARLVRDGPPPLNETIRILREVASALAYAHGHDIVHRDIKPDNVLMSGGAAMVTDFGVAKALDAAGNSGAFGTTSAGVAIGTPTYMAPEQAVADPTVDHRADLYAWGVLAYELIAGAPPFSGRSGQATIAAHLAEAPKPIGTMRAGVNPALAALVMRCLAKAPDDRPQTAEEIVRTLDAVVTPGAATINAPATATTNRGTKGVLATGVSAALLILIVVVALFMRHSGAAAPADNTLAVLPIENLGGDSTTQYLADGMTSELAHELQKVPGMQVAGDLSTFRFKGTRVAPAEIARQLHVGLLLTGKLQPGVGRVRLQMQLNRPDGKLLWSQTYDRENKDNFAMQDEITSAIASEMRMVLSPTVVAVAHAGRTTNPDAHDLYLRGVFEKNKVTPDGLQKALGYFQDALKLDPSYAQAHAGVAFVYDILADVYMPSHEYHSLSLVAAERAVAADSLLAEARVLHGYEIAAATWDFAAGRAEMERGLALNPNSPDALFMYGLFSYLSGDSSKAFSLADRLVHVDPLSALAQRLSAEAFAWGGRPAAALRVDSIAKSLDSMVVVWEATDGIAYLEMGRYDQALKAFSAFEKTFGQPSTGLAVTYGRMGNRTKALEQIRLLEARERRQWVDPDFIAIAYAGMGDADHTMQWLETAFRKRTFSLRALLGWDAPWFRGVENDPRFLDLRRRVLGTTFKS